MTETYLTSFPVTCSCCGQAHDRAAWLKLRRLGVSYVAADNYGPAESLELRNCVCGSTRAVRVVVTKVHVRQG